jgi:Predicted RNA-binding protein of the translin family
MNVMSMAEQIGREMEISEKKRESVISSSRVIIRKTKKVIHAIHLQEDHHVEMKELVKDVAVLVNDLDAETMRSAEDALMEFSEACIFESVVLEKRIPSYSDLGITSRSWALGLADSLGEIRRMILNLLLTGDVRKAEYLFKRMEEICEAVMSFDVPDAVLPIRRKQDVARSVTEKTRTDLVYSSLRN